jgi:hypothetical protein
MKTMMLSALIVATGIGLSGCAQPDAPGAHPDKLGDQGAPPRQVDASGNMGIAPARLERAAGSISARAMTWQKQTFWNCPASQSEAAEGTLWQTTMEMCHSTMKTCSPERGFGSENRFFGSEQPD